MCVRYTLHKTDAALAAISRALGVLLDIPDWARPRFNVALTDTMPVVARVQDATGVRPMRWGLVPAGERGSARPRLLANARSETAAKLLAFSASVAARRCLVPADGFYEWKLEGGVKRPYLFTLSDGEPFAFAGLWDPVSGDIPETYCILTTEPNKLVRTVHDRMPVILTPETMPQWLGDRPLESSVLTSLFRPIPSGRMAVRPVSRFVSNSRNEGPECLAPPDDAPPEPEFDFA